MVGSLCEAYGWTLDYALSLTVPQMILLSHESWVRHERWDRKWKKKRDKKDHQQEEEIPTFGGKKVTELNSREMASYYGSFFSEGFSEGE